MRKLVLLLTAITSVSALAAVAPPGNRGNPPTGNAPMVHGGGHPSTANGPITVCKDGAQATGWIFGGYGSKHTELQVAVVEVCKNRVWTYDPALNGGFVPPSRDRGPANTPCVDGTTVTGWEFDGLAGKDQAQYVAVVDICKKGQWYYEPDMNGGFIPAQ